MDEPLHELENELKALRPRRPSTLLRARVERELARPAVAAPRYTTATTLRSWKWFTWPVITGAAGVLAAVSVGIWQRPPHAPESAAVAADPPARSAPSTASASAGPGAPASSRAVYVPVAAASVLYDLRDEGEVTVPGETAARQARYRYVDTYTWKNPATNASLKFSVPRDEVRVIPARFQ